MARAIRTNLANYVYHVLNRANAGSTLFADDEDYATFERVLREAQERFSARFLGYCLMPDHWHLLLWSRADGELSQVLRWLTLTHTQRWHARHRAAGGGHLYRGRYKSFPVQKNEHLLSVLRFVEGNARRVGLVRRAEKWPWSSLWQRQQGARDDAPRLSGGPVALPANWVEHVNGPFAEGELAALRRSVVRGRPYGGERWVTRTAEILHLGSTLRPRGRPRKTADDS